MATNERDTAANRSEWKRDVISDEQYAAIDISDAAMMNYADESEAEREACEHDFAFFGPKCDVCIECGEVKMTGGAS